MQATIFTRHLKQLFSAPHVLIAYTVFAVAVAIADFLILPLTSDRIRESLVPYTGWVASMSYSFTIFFSLAMIFQQEGRRSMRMTIAGLLALQIVFSSLSILGASGENFGNPYLTISPWRAIWTILIPAAWIMTFYLPRMNRYRYENQKKEEA